MISRRVFLDHNGTTPIHPAAADAMRPLIEGLVGNPSSAHWAGRAGRALCGAAREKIALFLGTRPDGVVVTGSGSESNNHAIKGVAFARWGQGNHIVTTQVEHVSVLNSCRYLESKGFDVTYLPVDPFGRVDPDDVERAITEKTILISVMYGNNETGTVHPIREICAIARSRGILFHSDMIQTLGKIDVDVDRMGVDLASFSGHKVYGPKGIGVLTLGRGVVIDNLFHGGHQEAGRRAGTENPLAIAGLGAACAAVAEEMAPAGNRMEFLRKRLVHGIEEKIGNVVFNGHPIERLPNTVSVTFRGLSAESLLIALDLEGVAVSAGSACSAGAREPSHVLRAMGVAPELCMSTLRFSLGRDNSEDDMDYLLSVLVRVVPRLRKMGQ